MAGASQEGEQNYWPGFVDAMSNMVMAMIFIVLIFTAILFNAMQNHAKTLAEQSRRQKTEIATLRQQLTELKSTTKASQCAPVSAAPLAATPDSLTPKPVLVSTEGRFLPSETGKSEAPPQVSGSGALISVEYRSPSFALDTAATTALKDALGRQDADPAKTGVEITAEQASATGGASDAERAAFFRAIAIRNYFIAHGWKPADISVRLPRREQGAGPPHAYIRIFAHSAAGA
jgi:hypothetical protein